MPELATRLPCPVCPGVAMHKVGIGSGAAVEVDHCGRCGGVWLERGEVQGLRRLPPAAFWNAVARRRAEFRMRCHDCHAPLDRNAERCPACDWKNVLACPCCDRPMRRESREGLHLDVCAACRGAWFDHHELDTVWALGAATALAAHPTAAGVVGEAGSAGDVLLDVLLYAPDVAYLSAHAAVHTVSAAVEVAAHIPAAAAAAPEAAVALVEAAGEASGGVFEVIAAIFEGIFGLLDF